MKFNDNAQLDTSQVQDTRGSAGGGFGGGGGLGGINIGKGGLAGGGLGIVAVIAIVLFSMFSGGGSGGGLGGTGSGGAGSAGAGSGGGLLGQLSGSGGGTVDNSSLSQECKTGADANTHDDCAVVAIVNSVQSFWKGALAQSGTTYTISPTVFFTGQTSTGCGAASSGMGPFYCPADKKVYIDLSFWNDLTTQLGTNANTFTQAYVLAHEYGHHVQDILGTNSKVGSATGANSGSVRLELQADCYAGVWANHATTVPGADGRVLISDVSQDDINGALDAAAHIGDDYIQTHLGGGSVNSSQFTHGTSAQREKWFTTGWQGGNPATCDTFGTDNLG